MKSRLWLSCALILLMGCNLSDPVGPFQEPSLGTFTDVFGVERARIEPMTNAPEQLWWFERLGLR